MRQMTATAFNSNRRLIKGPMLWLPWRCSRKFKCNPMTADDKGQRVPGRCTGMVRVVGHCLRQRSSSSTLQTSVDLCQYSVQISSSNDDKARRKSGYPRNLTIRHACDHTQMLNMFAVYDKLQCED